MDTLRQDALDLTLDEFADVDAVAGADLHQRLMPLGVEFGADVFAIEGHALGPITREIRQIQWAKKTHSGGRSLIAEVFGELFDVADPGISDLATGDLLDGAP